MRYFMLILLLFLSFPVPAWPGQKGERKIDVDVQLYDHRLGIAKSEFLVEASSSDVWKVVLEEIDHWNEFVPNVLFARIVSQETADRIIAANTKSWDDVYKIVRTESLPLEKRVYKTSPSKTFCYKVLYMNLPWPIANRWVLQKEMDHYDTALKSYERRFDLLAGNVVRAEGYWRARPDPERSDWSRVYYENTYDAGLQVPEFVFKPSARHATKAWLEAMRTKAESYAKD